MKAIEIRNKYLDFFKRHGHAVIPSAPLIPENDPSVLFTTAGMQPLVPYLLGEKHPEGTRLTDFQKCLRTNDIDEVGDNRHLTYFEMLGNWSLGDYFKEESIAMSFEFLTKELGIPVEKLSVTCFAGDEDCQRDEVTASCWRKAGIPEDRIYYFGKDDNWWIAGEEGPCGPDTEMFYDTGKPKYAMLRGTYTPDKGQAFKGEASGSNKMYGFRMDGTCETHLYVFEAPIDALSHATLNIQRSKDMGIADWKNSWKRHTRLALGGTADVALGTYLATHPKVNEISFCLDRDEAGRTASAKYLEKYSAQGYKVNIYAVPENCGKDYNEYLCKVTESRKNASRQMSASYNKQRKTR